MMITQASATDWRGASLACRMAMGSTLTTPVTPPMYMHKMHYLHSNSDRAWSSAPRNVVFGLCCYIALLYITEFCLDFQWVQAVQPVIGSDGLCPLLVASKAISLLQDNQSHGFWSVQRRYFFSSSWSGECKLALGSQHGIG